MSQAASASATPARLRLVPPEEGWGETANDAESDSLNGNACSLGIAAKRIKHGQLIRADGDNGVFGLLDE